MSLQPIHDFSYRHIGVLTAVEQEMLEVLGVESTDELIRQTIPDSIRMDGDLNVPISTSEFKFLQEMRQIEAMNRQFRSYIGMGYYGTITPPVLLRNIFENPGWYTQYTPYQAEISQGRLEALLTFQTMVSDLTGLPISNASLLDEGTAAAEAMAMLHSVKNKRVKNPVDEANEIFVDEGVYQQTIDVLNSRAKPLGIKVKVGSWKETPDINERTFAVLLQYPTQTGSINDYSAYVAELKEKNIYTIVAADLMSLALLTPPGEWGADVAVGNTQRFGVPMGAGGPHAAYFATHDSFKRQIPGRIIGVSKDADGNRAYRMALQTREQHIKREKATSNICTAQALLAIMAGMYAVYHGPDQIKAIAAKIHQRAAYLYNSLDQFGYKIKYRHFFDTICIELDADLLTRINILADDAGMNFYYGPDYLTIAVDETTSRQDVEDILGVFASALDLAPTEYTTDAPTYHIPEDLKRKTDFMTHEVFNLYHTETKMMRFLKKLENKDLSLLHSMIPLGSCTMKLNAATQLVPVSWPGFAYVHPFAPAEQLEGYRKVIDELGAYLCEITGFQACSFMPNSGAQGELAGLLVIREYHLQRGDSKRNVALIPESAHGTNPASAVMAGMKVVVVKCDDHGNIDVDDLKEKVETYNEQLSALMVTYPSTHGVFETSIKEICQLVHDHGGMVYMDGANMNAQVGYTSPAIIGADVCHLNLHKTFSIPHGGGGPGMGPICVNNKLAPYLPVHWAAEVGGDFGIDSVSAAPWGSASILLISYAYIRLLGRQGLKDSTRYAILNANYVKACLESEYDILYAGSQGRCAHEVIVDLRPFKSFGVSAEDVAKRLIDYGFHAPTLSFPVAGTIMIEPTESESKAELDLFVEAMLQIKEEINEVMRGEVDPRNNVLVNAPHPIEKACADVWEYPYSRQKAVYPLPYLKEGHKFWVSVSRVDNAYGDRNLICTCPPIEMYMED